MNILSVQERRLGVNRKPLSFPNMFFRELFSTGHISRSIVLKIFISLAEEYCCRELWMWPWVSVKAGWRSRKWSVAGYKVRIVRRSLTFYQMKNNINYAKRRKTWEDLRPIVGDSSQLAGWVSLSSIKLEQYLLPCSQFKYGNLHI